MRYFDTSFLTPLVREEKTSSRIARFMAGLPAGELAISRWTEVEFASLLARDVRTGAIGSDKARAAGALFQDVILSPSSFCYRASTTTNWRNNICTILRLACEPAMPCISASLRAMVSRPSTAWTER
jgi:hypothetical protein